MLEVWTDGSGTVRGHGGGWAYLLVSNGKLVGGDAGSAPNATNNTMELSAAINGLAAAHNLIGVWERPDAPRTEVVLVSDSEYVLGLAAGDFQPNANVEMAGRLRRLAQLTGTGFRHVDGHSGSEFNELCDLWAKLKRKQAK